MPRGSRGALAALLIAGCAYATLHNREWGTDDAFISYRYATNLIEGHGLVFNPGERVEGYTNLLYVLIMAAGLWALPPVAAYPFSIAINALCLLATLAIVLHRLTQRVGPLRAGLGGLLFAASADIWQTAWNGLETSLVILLFVGIWSRIVALESTEADVEIDWPLCVLLSLSVLTRADGFVMAGICVAYLAFKGLRRPAVSSLCVVGVTALTNILFRYSYYGYVLPNTYYAKVTGALSDRLSYAWELIQRYGELSVYLLALALLVLVRSRSEGSLRKGIDFGAFFGAFWLAYWFYVGGDHFGIRFLLVVVILGAAAVAALWPERATHTRLRLLLILLLALALSAPPLWRSGFTRERTSYDRWIALGRFLAVEHPGMVIATGAAGKIPYYSGLETIDMLGLNDLHIAHLPAKFASPGHDKYDAQYVYSRRPDLIAGWIVDPDLGLSSGLSARSYQNAGYHLAYMVHEGPKPPWKGILDVRDRSLSKRNKLYQAGYTWGVLLRQDGE